MTTTYQREVTDAEWAFVQCSLPRCQVAWRSATHYGACSTPTSPSCTMAAPGWYLLSNFPERVIGVNLAATRRLV
jgi:hypothetical protein